MESIIRRILVPRVRNVGAAGYRASSSRSFCAPAVGIARQIDEDDMVNDFHFSGPHKDVLIRRWKDMNHFAARGDIEEVEKVFDEIYSLLPDRLHTSAHNMILKACAKSALVNHQASGVEHGVVETIMHGYDTDTHEEVQRFASSFEKKEVTYFPTYNDVADNRMGIDHPATTKVNQSNEVITAKRIFKSMMSNNVRFNARTFGKLMETAG